VNFKEIQLVGFKSFADKTQVKFDDGVTCIVGPNGCGKSNVADAVRWVLGEQSAKTLRGSSMQDVIFGGTEARRALSYCEVTLVFDNTDKLFDIEYDEVAMTRRLYRSGESEYLINKQPCRLKEIVRLLHGVGIGKEGYSIIGQGKVEQIMNAKPEDRRAIFEEATGVMAFKAQKAEIERKLESAKDNLNLHVQRMDEAEKQIKPLERQAETAKKYRVLNEELKYNEVNTYLFRCENASIETEKFNVRVEKAKERIGQIDGEISRIEADEESFREKVEEYDTKIMALNEELRNYSIKIVKRDGQAELIGERVSSYAEKLKRSSETVEFSIRRSAEIDGLVAEGKKAAEKAAKEATAAETEIQKLTQTVAVEDEKLMAFERDFEKTRASEMSSVENLSEIRAATGSLSAKREAVSGRIEETKIAIEKVKSRLTEYKTQLEACQSEKASVEAFLDEKDTREAEIVETVREREAASRKLTQDLVECNTSIANYTYKLNVQTELRNRFEGYRDSVKRLQIQARENPEIGSRIKGAIADIIGTDKKYEVAIETAFGGAMQNLVTATADDARYLIEYLKRTNGGIVTFLPVSSMRPHYDSREIKNALSENGALGLADELVTYDEYYDNVIKNLLGNTLVCDTIASATQIAKKYSHAFRIVTLDGDIVSTSGAMTGGSRSRSSGNLLAGERLIKELKEKIDGLEKLAGKLKSAIETSDKEREEALQEHENFRKKVQEMLASFAALSQRESALTSLVGESESTEKEYTELLHKFEAQAENIESEVVNTSETEDTLNKIRSEAAALLSARQEERDRLLAERDGHAAQLQELRVSLATLRSEERSKRDEVERLTLEKQELSRKIEETREEIIKTESTIKELEEQREQAAYTEEERAAVESLRAQIQALTQEKKSLSAAQLELGEHKRSVVSERQRCADETYKCGLEIQKIQSGLESWKERIEEAYGLDYEGALPFRDEQYDITQSYATINSLRHKIGALGPVNQNAEEDYDALIERYGTMQKEKEDVEKGVSDLTDALNTLRDQMQQKFDAGFTEINENFTHIFRELFGGGRAEMQLDYTDCDDPLNAGIEIVACPPGKKLTKISLLSGGERAFTAIAILFAILKSRPMPFCILDEIEAALDEANVDRFAKYLKKFSKETQFIVITHRKPTMNQADTLFGVTMEEKGVSKIVSVKLSEVEARLGGDTVM